MRVSELELESRASCRITQTPLQAHSHIIGTCSTKGNLSELLIEGFFLKENGFGAAS